MNLHITCIPSDPHFHEFCNDPNVAGIRMNGLLFKACNLAEQAALIPIGPTVPLWFDAKGRQLRVEESISYKDHLELVLNHSIQGMNTPHAIIFKAGEDWAMVEKVVDGGKRLVLRSDGYPKYRVNPGDSIHFRDRNISIADNLFTNDEKDKIEQVVKAGYSNFYLSYVERDRDVSEFRELIGAHAQLILKIENTKGLEFVRNIPGPISFKQYYPNTQLACARGDLYVEVDRPHDIVAAQKLIIDTDHDAIVGSRMLLSLFNNNVPSCSDINELAYLKNLGYENFLLCDDLCKKGSALHRAVETFTALSKTQI
jgi:pyruvate kinase